MYSVTTVYYLIRPVFENLSQTKQISMKRITYQTFQKYFHTLLIKPRPIVFSTHAQVDYLRDKL